MHVPMFSRGRVRRYPEPTPLKVKHKTRITKVFMALVPPQTALEERLNKMRLTLRLFALFVLVCVLALSNLLAPATKADFGELEGGSCSDACDTKYVACCKRLQGNAPQCPMSCTNDQIACNAKC